MKTNKLLLVVTFFLVSLINCSTILAQVGIGITTPNAALDVNSTTQGFLPPRVALTGTNASAPVTNPQTGSLISGTFIYNTATAGSGTTAVTPGYYYWNGTDWSRITSSDDGIIYGHFRSNVVQSLTSSTAGANKVAFGTTVSSGGATISYASSVFTLPANKTYKIEFYSPYVLFGNGQYLRFALYDDSSNTQFVNSTASYNMSITSTSNVANSGYFSCILTVGSTPQTISVRTAGGDTTNATIGDTTNGTSFPSISILEIR